MINDDTILEKLRWQQFDRLGKSYEVAEKKYDDILLYIFADPNISSPRTQKGGIDIKASYGLTCSSFRGIVLSFWDNIKQRTIFRCVEFKGTALDFKTKVWQKFETLKLLREASDNQTAIEGSRRIAEAIEIRELIEIGKRAFGKYQVEISKEESGYRLNLEINFNDKRELLNFCDKENL